MESGLSLDDELRHYEFFDLIYPILRSNAGMKKRDADFFSHQIARDILEKLEAEENGDRPN